MSNDEAIPRKRFGDAGDSGPPFVDCADLASARECWTGRPRAGAARPDRGSCRRRPPQPIPTTPQRFVQCSALGRGEVITFVISPRSTPSLGQVVGSSDQPSLLDMG